MGESTDSRETICPKGGHSRGPCDTRNHGRLARCWAIALSPQSIKPTGESAPWHGALLTSSPKADRSARPRPAVVFLLPPGLSLLHGSKRLSAQGNVAEVLAPDLRPPKFLPPRRHEPKSRPAWLGERKKEANRAVRATLRSVFGPSGAKDNKAPSKPIPR